MPTRVELWPETHSNHAFEKPAAMAETSAAPPGAILFALAERERERDKEREGDREREKGREREREKRE